MIPLILHQIWFGPSLPEFAVPFAETWREHERGLDMVLWASHPEAMPKDGPWTDIRPIPPFLQHELIPILDAYCDHSRPVISAAMSDLLRLQVVEEYGGIYADLDCLALVSPTVWLEGRRMVLAEEHLSGNVGNFLIAAERNHEAISTMQRAIWDKVIECRKKAIEHWLNPVKVTGPEVVGPVAKRMANSGSGGVSVLPYQRFSPWNARFEFPYDQFDKIDWPESAWGCHVFSSVWTTRRMNRLHAGADPFSGRFYNDTYPEALRAKWKRPPIKDSKEFR